MKDFLRILASAIAGLGAVKYFQLEGFWSLIVSLVVFLLVSFLYSYVSVNGEKKEGSEVISTKDINT